MAEKTSSSWIQNLNNITQLTVEQKQALTTKQTQEMVTALFQKMLSVYNTGIDIVYNNPYGLTVDQVNEGYGSNAVELVRLGTLLKDCINIAVPGTIPEPDPYNPLQFRRK